MHSDKLHLALIDIRDAAISAQNFVAGMSYEAFKLSRLHFFAVTRALEIVSEACRRLPEEFREQYPGMPWKKIMGAGNIYRHNYDNVQEQMVWVAAVNDLPPLLQMVEDELGRLDAR